MYEYEIKFYKLYTSVLFVEFLKDFFKESYIETIEDTSYIFNDETEGSIRYIKSSSDLIKQSKRVIDKTMDRNYKFTVAEETDLGVEPDIDLMKADRIRNRKREIYQVNINPDLFLHITHVNKKDYEVELEMTSEDSNLKDLFYKSFDKFLALIEPHMKNLQEFLYNFNGDYKPYMERDVIERPRDIHPIDLTTEKGHGIPEGYTLTIKGNGIPVLLSLVRGNLYIISASGKYFRLLHSISTVIKESFIIIGEFFEESEGATEAEGDIFAPFDILYWSRQKDIRNHPNHLERLETVKDILSRNKSLYEDRLKIFIKPFIPVGDSPESFAKVYNKIKDQSVAKKYPFKDDGMIMTPIYYPHNTGYVKGRDILSTHPKTCKVKPWHELSIDFRVDLKTEEVFVASSNISFKGTLRYTFDSKVNIDWASIPAEIGGIPLDDSIIEFSPTKKVISDNEEIIVMKFNRHRFDKSTANGSTAAIDVWGLLNDPVKEETLKGKDFTRLRLQNNDVKRIIIGKIKRGSIVVDIGIGAGGDISKYDKAGVDTVLGIEPSESHREEFYKRLESIKPKTKFIVLPIGGEETDKILEAFKEIRNGRPDAEVVVISMLSLTFFWQSRSMLDRFENTLKAIARHALGATFHFFTVEGARLLEYFKENNNKISNYGLKAIFDPNDKGGVSLKGKVRIQILGSITVTKPQTEYLVRLEDLKCLKNLKYTEAVIESYLTKEELRYGKCSVFGSAQIDFS
jgi:hypothetical protein